ncbi:hypothetical protein C6A87_028380 [Mycobacterium sp. ITM-2016-00317]|uniref:hypothetical protein n=1 Tax=Mycobacterium sp. ITM-2016-00317 TaxID=2099694 RepID=UPI00287F476F|nr:hypothetical protein [Mycobacterium sp. ITM-2016-00317]WNG87592.1 hypothetical protein C6A87_028380 [Mycobacterium sp. ITM-2016-00317]
MGRPSELTASMAAALRRRGVSVIEAPARRGPAGRVAASESMILVIDGDLAEELFAAGSSWRSRRRTGEWENDACDLVVAGALDTGARSVFVVCDGRRLTFGQRARVVGVFRRLARRVDYECVINGLRPVTTSYAVIDSDGDVARLAHALGESLVRIQGFPGRKKAARKTRTGRAWMAGILPQPSQKEHKPCPKSSGG